MSFRDLLDTSQALALASKLYPDEFLFGPDIAVNIVLDFILPSSKSALLTPSLF